MKYLKLPIPDSQTPAVKESQNSRTDTVLWYCVYGLLLVILAVVAVIFWAAAAHKSIIYPYYFGIWLRANPKTGTILWTTLGSLLSAATLYLLNGLLLLMNKQVSERKGATLSTIEAWGKLLNHTFILDFHRTKLSLFSLLFWGVALYLSTAYTTLLTPTNILVVEQVYGSELDFTSREFWSWYNTFDPNGRPVRKISGCTWYSYTSPNGDLIFHTCPFVGDPVSFISAGVSATQSQLGINGSAIAVSGCVFSGSTSGVIPLGWAGISAFNNVSFENWSSDTYYPSFNYSLNQQGLTAEVSCVETPTSPITRVVKDTYNVTLAGGSKMIGQDFSVEIDNCNRGEYAITASISSAALSICQFDPSVKNYTVYLSPFDGYAKPNPYAQNLSFPNLTCTIIPQIANVSVLYTTNTNSFNTTILDIIPESSSKVPNETVESIEQLFSLSISTWGNTLIDSLYEVYIQSTAASTPITFANAFALAMRGFIEYESSNLRIYYAANSAPGFRSITGEYSVWRVGYDGPPISLISFLLPMIFILGMACGYVFLGVRTKRRYVSGFEATNSTCLIVASAAGGAAGYLPLLRDGGLRVKDERVLGTRVRFTGQDGLVVVPESGTDVEEFQILTSRDALL